MSPWRVIATLPDNRVSVVCPSARMIEVLKQGEGAWWTAAHDLRRGVQRWGLAKWLAANPARLAAAAAHAIRGELPYWLAREWEIAKYVNDPHPSKIRAGRAEFAALWVDAKTYGGLSEREAIMLIWEYTRREGAIHPDSAVPEIVRAEELPWAQRPAWRRSHNGGPVWIQEEPHEQRAA